MNLKIIGCLREGFPPIDNTYTVTTMAFLQAIDLIVYSERHEYNEDGKQ